MQIVDRQHDELLEGGSSDGVAGAVFHALLAASDPDGGADASDSDVGAELGEVSVLFIDVLRLPTFRRQVLGDDQFQKCQG